MCSILIQPLALCFQALLPLVTESTDKGKIKAAQALAKITITHNPQIAFPGERVSVAWFFGFGLELASERFTRDAGELCPFKDISMF